jgi:hypothetical protein
MTKDGDVKKELAVTGIGKDVVRLGLLRGWPTKRIGLIKAE